MTAPERALFAIKAADDNDREWVVRVLTERWGSPRMVSRGRVQAADTLPAFVAVGSDGNIGLATYAIAAQPMETLRAKTLRREERACELVSLDSFSPGHGVGTALINAVVDAARRAGCWRLWLVTTNDNLAALRFYQKHGFALVAVHKNALDVSRRLKPEIPLIGLDGIALRDEIELELTL